MRIEGEGGKASLEELLQAYPEISVYRSAIGFFDIIKNLGPDVWEEIAVTIRQNRLIAEPTQILIAGSTVTRQERKAEKQAPAGVIRTVENNLTYITITRPEGGEVEAEIIYPADEGKRIDYALLLQDAKHGLEIFEAFSKQVAKEDREKYQTRVEDDMADFDSEYYGKLVDTITRDIDPDFKDFLGQTGIDSRMIKGWPAFAIQTMRRISSLTVTRITVNQPRP